jgi:hypothetical protein
VTLGDWWSRRSGGLSSSVQKAVKVWFGPKVENMIEGIFEIRFHDTEIEEYPSKLPL